VPHIEPKVIIDNQVSRIRYNYYINNVSIDYDDSQQNRTAEDYITLQERQPGRKFCALHRFCKERRRSLRDCFEYGDTTHIITDCPKRKKLDSSSKYNYNNRNDSSDKGEGKKKYRFGDKKKKKF
jgi:hypothetical protein